MTQSVALKLASSSPRRREILSALGLEFSIAAAEVDETPFADETAVDMVVRLAVTKAEAVAAMPGDLIIAADTAVVIDSRVLGKPADRDECLAMLGALAGQRHTVFTGVALRSNDETRTTVSETDVFFRNISRDEALAYWQSGEPRDKAGAYAIQGIGGAFVERIEGSYSGVVGLPIFETVELLREVGFDLLSRR